MIRTAALRCLLARSRSSFSSKFAPPLRSRSPFASSFSSSSSSPSSSPSSASSSSTADADLEEGEADNYISVGPSLTSSSPASAATVPTLLQPRVVIYDGVCHLCHRGLISKIPNFFILVGFDGALTVRYNAHISYFCYLISRIVGILV